MAPVVLFGTGTSGIFRSSQDSKLHQPVILLQKHPASGKESFFPYKNVPPRTLRMMDMMDRLGESDGWA
jgi:hypothetical protein